MAALPGPEPARMATVRSTPAPRYSAEKIFDSKIWDSKISDSDSRNAHQPGANRIGHKLGCFVNAEGVHDVGAMNRDGVGTEIER